MKEWLINFSFRWYHVLYWMQRSTHY